jgi:hypothetical protein
MFRRELCDPTLAARTNTWRGWGTRQPASGKRQQQIPYRNDNKKSKDKGEGKDNL